MKSGNYYQSYQKYKKRYLQLIGASDFKHMVDQHISQGDGTKLFGTESFLDRKTLGDLRQALGRDALSLLTPTNLHEYVVTDRLRHQVAAKLYDLYENYGNVTENPINQTAIRYLVNFCVAKGLFKRLKLLSTCLEQSFKSLRFLPLAERTSWTGRKYAAIRKSRSFGIGGSGCSWSLFGKVYFDNPIEDNIPYGVVHLIWQELFGRDNIGFNTIYHELGMPESDNHTMLVETIYNQAIQEPSIINDYCS